jgi:hypothetical protein
MGQYHKTVSMDAHEYLDPHPLGCMMKAWEQVGGGTVAALASLLAYKPGNMPADMGHHPMIGHWAGHRLLVVGDYAERRDIKKFQGPPLDRLYSLCNAAPNWDDFKNIPPRVYYKQGRSESSDRWHLFGEGPIVRKVETAEMRFKEAMKDHNSRTVKGKYEVLPDISSKLRGLIEDALSIRFCGRYNTAVPVMPLAQRGTDGHLHYVLPDYLVRDTKPDRMGELDILWRMMGFGGWDKHPTPDATCLPVGMDRWPWDRAPLDLSHHNVRDADADVGQTRVFANLDRREYVDPIAFGEQPTLAGIMRASACDHHQRMAIDMLIGPTGVQSNVRTGDNGLGCASAIWAMLLHPETRGGGDISAEDFSQVGRWRNNRLVLTSEYEGDFPSTDDVRSTFTDISGEVLQATALLAAA